MKGIDIFCASQASTAISLSMDQPSSSSCSNTIQLGGRAIDRHNPIITDSRRTPSRDFTASSSSSKPPIDPKPCHDLRKAKKKSSSSSSSSSKPSDQNKKNATKAHHHDQKKKSVAEKLTEHITNNYSSKPIDSILRRSWIRPPADLVTPPGSSRYLLSDTASLGGVSDSDSALALTTVDDKKVQLVHQDETNHASKPSSSSGPKSGSSDQVSYLSPTLSSYSHIHGNMALIQDSSI